MTDGHIFHWLYRNFYLFAGGHPGQGKLSFWHFIELSLLGLCSLDCVVPLLTVIKGRPFLTLVILFIGLLFARYQFILLGRLVAPPSSKLQPRPYSAWISFGSGKILLTAAATGLVNYDDVTLTVVCPLTWLISWHLNDRWWSAAGDKVFCPIHSPPPPAQWLLPILSPPSC